MGGCPVLAGPLWTSTSLSRAHTTQLWNYGTQEGKQCWFISVSSHCLACILLANFRRWSHYFIETLYANTYKCVERFEKSCGLFNENWVKKLLLLLKFVYKFLCFYPFLTLFLILKKYIFCKRIWIGLSTTYNSLIASTKSHCQHNLFL